MVIKVNKPTFRLHDPRLGDVMYTTRGEPASKMEEVLSMPEETVQNIPMTRNEVIQYEELLNRMLGKPPQE